MKNLNRLTANLTSALPLRVIQFGEGNFLRAFVDWMIHEMNKSGFDSGIAVVQPIEQGMVDSLSEQEGLFHHVTRGLSNGETINEAVLNTSIQQCINPFQSYDSFMKLAELPELQLVVSNTTEAGIEFIEEGQPLPGELAKTFPGKLTQLLKQRFDTFKGDEEKGLALLPCELIEQNGVHLKKAILDYANHWEFDPNFTDWIEKACSFANTLVDRIVPGFPAEEINEIQERIGFSDQMVVASEIYHFMVIEGDRKVKAAFPADKYGLNVKYVKDLSSYRTRKVRILNGAHTCMVPVALLAGLETVQSAVEDEHVGWFIDCLLREEIGPTVHLPNEEVAHFTNEVIERFRNPFIKHRLITISLNSIAKFKVRVLPTIKDYYAMHAKCPEKLAFALASLIMLYLKQDEFELKDDPAVLAFFKDLRNNSPENIATSVLSNTTFWGEDQSKKMDLIEVVTHHLSQFQQADDIRELIAR